MMMRNFRRSIKDRLVHILSCCDRNKEPGRAIEIGYPTDFRRVDITLPGLSEQEQIKIRTKAQTDVHCIFAGLPTSPAASPNQQQGPFIDAHGITTPQATELSPLVSSPVPFSPSKFDKIMQHARRASQRFGLLDLQNSPYEPVHATNTEHNSVVNMSSVDVSRRESFDGKGFEDRHIMVEWSGKDLATLGGSDQADREKGSVVMTGDFSQD